jgi:hypothetical protein
VRKVGQPASSRQQIPRRSASRNDNVKTWRHTRRSKLRLYPRADSVQLRIFAACVRPWKMAREASSSATERSGCH